MAYTRVNWENLPSTNTPLNATNLNKMDAGIASLDTDLGSLVSNLKFNYDSTTNSYYATFGQIKIVIAEIDYTTGNTSPYTVTWNYTSPVSFTKGIIYTTAVSGNIYRNIQIRPSGNDMTGNTTSGIVLSDIANYSNKFNILIIGY